MEDRTQEMKNLKRFVYQLIHGQTPDKELLPPMWQQKFAYMQMEWQGLKQYLNELEHGNLAAPPPEGNSEMCQHAQRLHHSLQVLQKRHQERLSDENVSEMDKDWYIQEIEATQQVMFHVITHMHSGVRAMDLATGKVIYENEYRQKQREVNPKRERIIVKNLEEWPKHCKEVWYITMQSDKLSQQPLEIWMVQSFLWNWQGRPAVIHVLTDYSEEHMRQKKMEQAAFTDSLTGLYNRRYGRMQADLLMKNQIPFLFCFIDMDGLKRINDTMGHAKGDMAITAVANALQRVFRHDDTIIRIGGDEFIVILPQCNDLQLAEHRFIVAHQLLEKTEFPFSITFSYGIEPVAAGDKRSIGEILNVADQKMYQHKQSKYSV